MKIGIFGDSFAAYNAYLLSPTFSNVEDKNRKAWWDYLKEDFTVENNAVGGSSLFYTYTQFKKFYRTYDYIIILVTDYGRVWLPQLNTVYPWVPGYRQAERYLEICKDEEDKKILESLLDYYMYVEDSNYVMEMHRLMCKEMINMCKNVLLIPCFNNEHQSLVPNYEGQCLEDISKLDSDHYNVVLHETGCRRHGHLNDANHYILYQKINEWIKSDGSKKFEINLKDYKKPTEPFEYNFFSQRPPLIDYSTGKFID